MTKSLRWEILYFSCANERENVSSSCRLLSCQIKGGLAVTERVRSENGENNFHAHTLAAGGKDRKEE
jgi:hypothetical protein